MGSCWVDDDTSVLNEKSAGLLGHFTFFWAFFLDLIESKPFSYRHFRLFQQTLTILPLFFKLIRLGKLFVRNHLIKEVLSACLCQNLLSTGRRRFIVISDKSDTL
jgi:hypothetical protein